MLHCWEDRGKEERQKERKRKTERKREIKTKTERKTERQKERQTEKRKRYLRFRVNLNICNRSEEFGGKILNSIKLRDSVPVWVLHSSELTHC